MEFLVTIAHIRAIFQYPEQGVYRFCIFNLAFIEGRRFKFIISVKMKTALVFLAPGAEEMEFTIAVDVLRRAGVIDEFRR